MRAPFRQVIAAAMMLALALWVTEGEAFDFDYQSVGPFRECRPADDLGVVRRTFKIDVPGVQYAYNPSIVSVQDSYILAFRHDYPWAGFQAVVGLIKLDKNFQSISSKSYLDTGCSSSEDPRLFKTKDGLFAIYTNNINRKPSGCHLAVSQIDAERLTGISREDLQFKLNKREKNWTPFVRTCEHTGAQEAFLIYKYAPQQILKLHMPLRGAVDMVHGNGPEKNVRTWEKKWGEIRGGASALKIDDEFLTFFHSSFVAGDIRYYVMGALTFNANPPFQITRISPYPIIFKGIYEAPISPHVWFYPRNNLRVLFPGGFVVGQESGRDVFYVVCGENDVAIKCVVIDKDKLYRSFISAR